MYTSTLLRRLNPQHWTQGPVIASRRPYNATHYRSLSPGSSPHDCSVKRGGA